MDRPRHPGARGPVSGNLEGHRAAEHDNREQCCALPRYPRRCHLRLRAGAPGAGRRPKDADPRALVDIRLGRARRLHRRDTRRRHRGEVGAQRIVARLGSGMTRIDPAALAGAWRLTRWHNTIDGRVSTPLGGEPHGLLIYAADGWMAVQITASHRAAIDTADPLGGDELQRAAAYATSLSYCGRYEVDGEQLIHA